jgi:hypothetical protein
MKVMVRKGTREEIFSQTRVSRESNQHMIFFRYFKKMKETPFPKFIKEFSNFQKIPTFRIIMIGKNNTNLFKKNSKQDND